MSQITRAIVIAGGVGNRFSGHFIPKQFVEIEGKPIIAFTLENVQQVREINEVVLVINKDYEQLYKDILKTYKLDGIRCIDGGSTRQQSIKSGIREAAGSDYVVVQNAVCPLTEPKLISEVLNQTISKNISTSAYIDVIDTIVRQSDGVIGDYLHRDSLVKLQAPQAFPYALIKECHEKAEKDGLLEVTNDANLLTHYGHQMQLVRGSFDNIKITTTEDWLLAKIILKSKVSFPK